jgi:predicted transcriptional regulator
LTTHSGRFKGSNIFGVYKLSSFERKGNETMTTLGKEIKKARIDKGLKQKDLMALTGLTQKHLSLIENDGVDPAVSVLRKIALALGVSADQLLGITQEQVGKASED